MPITAQTISYIKGHYESSPLPANRQKIEEGAKDDNLNINHKKVFQHLKLTFDALDRLFALSVPLKGPDVYPINSEVRVDKAQTNAEAYLGDAYRNLFLAKHYIALGEENGLPESLRDQNFTFALDSFRMAINGKLNEEQKDFYKDSENIFNSFDTANMFTRLPLEKERDELSWMDYFNRTIRDQRFELFDQEWFKSEALGDTLIVQPDQRDWLEFHGFIGRELDLRKLGNFKPMALNQIPQLLEMQIDKMPHLKKIHFTEHDKTKLLRMQVIQANPRLQDLID